MGKEDKQMQFYISPDGEELSPNRKRGFEPLIPAEKPKKTKRRTSTPYQEAMQYYRQLERYENQDSDSRSENVNGGVTFVHTRGGTVFTSHVGEDGENFTTSFDPIKKPDFESLSPGAKKIYFLIKSGKIG